MSENDDLATLLQRREHAKPTRLTWVLLTLLVLTIGFIGGAVAGQRLGATTSPSGGSFAMPAGMPTSFPSGAGFPGGLGDGTAADTGGSGTSGTVKLVDGENLYLTDSSGNTVKVIVPSTATVTSQRAAELADLKPGATVLVSGETADDGTVTASSVAAAALPTPDPSEQGAN